MVDTVEKHRAVVRAELTKAIGMHGSQGKLGKAIGVSQNAIWNALRQGRVSAELATGLHLATKGKVDKAKVRPDLFQRQKRRKKKAS